MNESHRPDPLPACACSLCPGRRHVTAPALAPAACPALPLPTPWVNTQSPARASWTSVIASKAGRGGRGGGRRKSGGTLPQASAGLVVSAVPSDWGGFRSPPVTPPPAHTQRNKNKKHAAFRALRDSSRCGTAPAKARRPARPRVPSPTPASPGPPLCGFSPTAALGFPASARFLVLSSL